MNIGYLTGLGLSAAQAEAVLERMTKEEEARARLAGQEKREAQADAPRRAAVETPPEQVYGPSREEILSMKDPFLRQEAIARHHALFGF